MFKTASDNGAKSIALPVLGLGRMLKYPTGYIKEALVDEITKAAMTYKFKVVYILWIILI